MFATRSDQENLIHTHQQAAAAKPLNQGLKGYGTKTPGPKTPFRVPLNDENAQGGGKSMLRTNGKGKETLALRGKNGGELDKSTFVTPAGPRNRAPLGMKTTNAKAKAFQTPGPMTGNDKTAKTLQKTVSPRLKRPKVKVHQPEPVAQLEVEDDSEPEIEYMPPKEVPLPDYPESPGSDSYFGPNKKFPMFEGDNFARGWADVYLNAKDSNGMTRQDREDQRMEEKLKAQEEEFERHMERVEAERDVRLRIELGLPPLKTTAPEQPVSSKALKPKSTNAGTNASRAGTLSSRAAAAALTAPTKSSLARQQPGTTAPKQANANKLPSSKVRGTSKHGDENVLAQNDAGVAASKSTMGYNRGRVMSSSLKQAVAGKDSRKDNILKQKTGNMKSLQPAAPKNKISDFDDMLSLAMSGQDDNDLSDVFGRPSPFGDEEEDLFQLKLED